MLESNMIYNGLVASASVLGNDRMVVFSVSKSDYGFFYHKFELDNEDRHLHSSESLHYETNLQ